MASRLSLDLPRRPTAPAAARSALARFERQLARETLRTAELLISELVTNAVKYGHGPLRVELALADGRLRAEVTDRGSGFSHDGRKTDDLETPGGWGLHLVEALSDSWGHREGSTKVWFELASPH
jgi:anti-sigma regulatory factor (Ser/Thr protein kinase)